MTTTETEPITIEQLSHDLADAQTVINLLTYERDQALHERDRAQAEMDHYIAAVMAVDDTDTPLLFSVLRRLKIVEKNAALWEREGTKRQAEFIRLGQRNETLASALAYALKQCTASGHVDSEPHIVQGRAALKLYLDTRDG